MEKDLNFDVDALQEEWEKEFSLEDQEELEGGQDQEEIEQDEQENIEEDSEGEEDSANEEDSDEQDEEELAEDQDDELEEQQEEEDQPQEKDENELEYYRTQYEELQRQMEEMNKVASVVDEIAKQNGVDRSELLKKYEQSQLEQQAQREGVPVEYLERQRNMEQELNTLRQERQRDTFNRNVSETVKKFGLSDNDVKSTIDYAYQNGIDLFNGQIGFEAIYKAANFDKILEKQVKETRQKELAAKQKRMKSAGVSHGGSQGQAESVDDDVMNFLKEQGIL